MENDLPDGSKIKVIVTDLDGTLLNSEGNVSERTKTVVGKILDKYSDVHFVLATGRSRRGASVVRKALGIENKPNTESILGNGCFIYDSNGKLLWENTLPLDYVFKFHNLLKPYPKAVYNYTYEDKLLGFDKKWAKETYKAIKDTIVLEDKEEHMKKVLAGEETRINRVCYFASPDEGRELLEKIKKLGEEYKLEYAQYAPTIIEFMPYQTNKGTGLTQLIKLLNISKEEVIAFGDGGNDYQLLESAGWPVAMENAHEDLKSYAKIITKSNVEDGVADLLEKIFLKEDFMN
ncbi:hypothetical protein H8356DRAFT_1290213 [Neocallimastix lanati (nom. inval.)]|jgi:hypothetical protein|uniref:HAD-like protein n=1 Tax=Neocallimastix californiae TaxID=1754190 RepID=A0A1Y2EX54_9FUNG|nr:hypothetical protein H8356DRAFT_1290213 [Neocallimastix sp. JGI-2020a]ORY76148.1 hypothetical protein LY90DRAFT_377506 [Neocallimastix californiae]|eukprot:ORY76148.1 hypothetical protein LY90DRAFT_377506 [Neocallimastix californiae]